MLTMAPDAPGKTVSVDIPLMDLAVPQALQTACFAFG
jgi:hypothetical protein